MAKVSFNKLGLKINQDIKTINYNDQIIEIKQYLPIEEKLELISDIINFSADENNFANPLKIEAYTVLGIIEYYTNINFTEKQKENTPKLFDIINSSGLYEIIKQAIPELELNTLNQAIINTIESIYKYKNSVMGVLEMATADYSNLNLDATNIQSKLADPENMDLLRNVLSKLG